MTVTEQSPHRHEHAGRHYFFCGARCREKFAADPARYLSPQPDLAEALYGAPDPERAMARWETLLARLPTAINLFRLFEQRPGLLGQVLRILTLAPPLADALARRVELLDALIDFCAPARAG